MKGRLKSTETIARSANSTQKKRRVIKLFKSYWPISLKPRFTPQTNLHRFRIAPEFWTIHTRRDTARSPRRGPVLHTEGRVSQRSSYLKFWANTIRMGRICSFFATIEPLRILVGGFLTRNHSSGGLTQNLRHSVGIFGFTDLLLLASQSWSAQSSTSFNRRTSVPLSISFAATIPRDE